MAQSAHRFSRKELVRLLDGAIGHTLGEIDSANVLGRSERNKGNAGAVFEQSVLGYPADSDKRPDLIVDGVPTELKVTGLVASPKSSRGWRAKEPMSITAVTPDDIVKEEFFTSAFWEKAEHLLIVYYLYVRPGKGIKFAQYATFEVKGYDFHIWSELDVKRLKADWTLVRDFVDFALKQNRERWLPELSSLINRELLYLDTSPKYPNPPRFRFKNSFVTAIAEEHFGTAGIDATAITSMKDIDNHLATCRERFARKTIAQIAEALGLKLAQGKPAKSLTEQAIVQMLTGHPGKLRNVELFTKASITCSSVTITTSGKRTEDMKVEPSLDFDDLLDPEASFEDSTLASQFIGTSIICAVFEESPHETDRMNNRFLGFKRLWLGELSQDAQRLWETIRDLVFNNKLVDVPVLDRNGKPKLSRITGFPSSAPNWPKSRDGVLFLRGSGRNARDKTVSINGVRMYRQNVWVKGIWIAEQLSRYEYL